MIELGVVEEVGPDLLPEMYTRSFFWRFLLDTKAGAKRPEEPRLKQFADNLRSFAVCGVILKAGKTMAASHSHSLVFGGWILIVAASVVAVGCAMQLLGLLVIASHWSAGWGVWDHVGLTGDKERLKRLHESGLRWLKPKAYAKFIIMVAVPLLLMFALVAFVFVPLN